MSTPVSLWSFTLKRDPETTFTHNINALARLQRVEQKLPAACISGDFIHLTETGAWATVKEVRDFDPINSTQSMLLSTAVTPEFVFVFEEKARPCICKVAPAQIEHGDTLLHEASGKKFYVTVEAISYNAGQWVTKADKRVKK